MSGAVLRFLAGAGLGLAVGRLTDGWVDFLLVAAGLIVWQELDRMADKRGTL